MKALVAQELSGPSGLAYTDVDDPADVSEDAVVVDVGAARGCVSPTYCSCAANTS